MRRLLLLGLLCCTPLFGVQRVIVIHSMEIGEVSLNLKVNSLLNQGWKVVFITQVGSNILFTLENNTISPRAAERTVPLFVPVEQDKKR